MNLFFDCFAAHADGAGADHLFPSIVERSPFQLWRPGDSIPRHAVRLLIGAAPSSAYDMRLLDIVMEALARAPSAAPAVDVFNTADCQRPEDLRRYIPTLRAASPTPVAGIWFGGQLTWYGQGPTVRDQITRMFGATSEQVVDYVNRWTQTRISPQGA